VPLTVNDSRMVYLRDNARIVAEIGDALPDGWPGVALMVTNPVDPLCTLLHRRRGLDRRRLIGYTANDSLRLRTGIGEQLGVRSSAVDAWVRGEHGDCFVPLFDRVRVDGAPVTLAPAHAEAAERFVRHWYETHVALDSGRSSTWTTGRGLARMLAALSRDEGELWPASVVLEGEYGVDGVALTVPATIARGGVQALHEWNLTGAQEAAMHRAAFAVREALYSVA
jgi:malate/lactate dehydrogenase